MRCIQCADPRRTFRVPTGETPVGNNNYREKCVMETGSFLLNKTSSSIIFFNFEPARRRDYHRPSHPRRGVGHHHGDEYRCGCTPVVCPVVGCQCEVLGSQREWPARGRDHHRPQQPRWGDGYHDGDEHRCWSILLVCPTDGRQGELLGHRYRDDPTHYPC